MFYFVYTSFKDFDDIENITFLKFVATESWNVRKSCSAYIFKKMWATGTNREMIKCIEIGKFSAKKSSSFYVRLMLARFIRGYSFTSISISVCQFRLDGNKLLSSATLYHTFSHTHRVKLINMIIQHFESFKKKRKKYIWDTPSSTDYLLSYLQHFLIFPHDFSSASRIAITVCTKSIFSKFLEHFHWVFSRVQFFLALWSWNAIENQ